MHNQHILLTIKSLLSKHNINSEQAIQYIENSIKIKPNSIEDDRFSIGIPMMYLSQSFIIDVLETLVPNHKYKLLSLFDKEINNPCSHHFFMLGNDNQDIEIYFEHIDSGHSYDCGKNEYSTYDTTQSPTIVYDILKSFIPQHYYDCLTSIIPLHKCRLVYQKINKKYKHVFLIRRIGKEPVHKFQTQLLSLSQLVNKTHSLHNYLQSHRNDSLEWIGIGINHNNDIFLTYYMRPYTKCSICK